MFDIDHRTPIAVIDSGYTHENSEFVLCKGLRFDLTNTGIRDVMGHGTAITSIIAERTDLTKFCIMPIKWIHSPVHYRNMTQNEDRETVDQIASTAVNLAIKHKAKIINMSLDGRLYLPKERKSIINALINGIKVVVAAGNKGEDLYQSCRSYPACYEVGLPGFYVVANYVGLFRVSSSNYGGPVNAKENGHNLLVNGKYETGTSMSAAIKTSKLTQMHSE